MPLPNASRHSAARATLGPLVPQHRGRAMRAFGHWALRLLGWRVTGDIPNLSHFVIIVAPHTSNWDFPVGLLAKWALGLRVTWLGKDTLFVPPLGWFMRAIGGVPVTRGTANALVDHSIQQFEARDQMVLVLAPEGTRKKVTKWKSGFWHIARKGNVPVVCAAIDWGNREIRFGPTLMVDASVEPDKDIARIKAYYRDVRGYHRALEA